MGAKLAEGDFSKSSYKSRPINKVNNFKQTEYINNVAKNNEIKKLGDNNEPKK